MQRLINVSPCVGTANRSAQQNKERNGEQGKGCKLVDHHQRNIGKTPHPIKCHQKAGGHEGQAPRNRKAREQDHQGHKEDQTPDLQFIHAGCSCSSGRKKTMISATYWAEVMKKPMGMVA